MTNKSYLHRLGDGSIFPFSNEKLCSCRTLDAHFISAANHHPSSNQASALA